MEDYVVLVRSDDQGFSFAAGFDGHAGLSSVKCPRDELYRQCVEALQGGLLLNRKNFNEIRKAFQDAFQNAMQNSKIGLDAVSFCKGLRRVGWKPSLVQQPLLCSLTTICCSFHMLVTHSWFFHDLETLKY